jgi:hypothetical protein
MPDSKCSTQPTELYENYGKKYASLVARIESVTILSKAFDQKPLHTQVNKVRRSI